MSDEAINDRAVEKNDAQMEAANQECSTCDGTGCLECPDGCGDVIDCPDCYGEGVAW